jgi:hypothetical protein
VPVRVPCWRQLSPREQFGRVVTLLRAGDGLRTSAGSDGHFAKWCSPRRKAAMGDTSDVQIAGVSKAEEEDARRLLAEWTEQTLSGPVCEDRASSILAMQLVSADLPRTPARRGTGYGVRAATCPLFSSCMRANGLAT